MNAAAAILIGLVALLHLSFLVLEVFLWTTPTGRRAFGLDAAFAEQSRTLAANQGLYNGFLAAGLVWGLVAWRADVQVFFLVCVVVAGVYGAVTAARSILFAQALPAAAALIVTFLSRSS